MATITYTIDNAKLAEFKAGFLKMFPVREGFAGSEEAWIKEWGKENFMDIYRAGKKKIAEESLSILGDIIT